MERSSASARCYRCGCGAPNNGRTYTPAAAISETRKLPDKLKLQYEPARLFRRAGLSLEAGDELLVLCKSDRIVIIPKPKKFTRRTAGLHREVWIGAEAYLQEERDSW